MKLNGTNSCCTPYACRCFLCRLSKIAHLITLNKVAKQRADFPLHFVEHGVPSHFKAPRSRLRRQNHVASFGFWDEAKRHDQLCEVAEDAEVAFDLYSQPPAKFGLAGCEGLVSYHREFLDTPKLVTRLSEYSALVFLRRPSHEVYAVSGAARMALTANIPVICEDSMHYEDLAEAVDLVPFDQIPSRIREVVSNETLREELVARQNAFVARWSDQETQRSHFLLYQSLKPISPENNPSELEIVSGDESKRLSDKMNTFDDSAINQLVEDARQEGEQALWDRRGIRFEL